MEITNLDKIVLEALDFFSENNPPKLDLGKFSLPFVVGSGNAYNTGTIVFSDKAAIFADESNFKSMMESYRPAIEKGLITQAIIISASGEKDSVWETELAKEKGLRTTLLTCGQDSSASKIADEVFTYRKIAEPYTYNTSTYLGMILSATQESADDIKKLIQNIELPENFDKYEGYAFVLPDRFSNICPMLDIKKSELFGPHVSVRAFPEGHARHAKFVIPTEKELVISIGSKNEFFGHPGHRWEIDFPENASFGAMLCLTYFLIGKIQESKPPYFKENIDAYCNDYGPKAYGKDTPFETIVPGN
ncbi:MAG: hypothetical protein UY41_C0025G0003 [Candidatus Moranbacteria bacterium GW2011_GWE1_49_15]|nr:MAG: hypothetical protein UX75_C0038G0002 [Candidatus Moranbacteria bacterium GW2011_GWE2_47_10]KKW06449.1 MAG: hypothetical protein UY41_C0025G0003 [Candidatus Moranbacteria bacterium GW2011_GWE1_49_15]HBP00733.1 hypothetical protein [Candidatus Moranbacteria bacterium]